MEKVSWKERVRNEEVLRRVEVESRAVESESESWSRKEF
jgi:hypothetical protein